MRLNVEILISVIRERVREFPATFSGTTDFGDKYEVVMEIEGVVGRKSIVETAWIIERGSDMPRLISAYIPKKR